MEEFSIFELQRSMAEGELTALALTRAYLRRIAEVDQAGPRLNAVIEVNPAAEEDAALMDAERADGRPRGLLHGIPILLKDNIDTADRMLTTAGSLALQGHCAAQDATLVERLRAAGALILGKTNLSEWANFRSDHSVSGWSSRGGQTRNPYALDRNPCGSSSGSGAAVAANLCAVAVGTETDGSIVCPAHACGIVGIKPTLGLVSRAGIIPIAHSQDTAGPMARSVADAALLLAALAGPDARDAATEAAHGHFPTDYTPFLDPTGLQGARIGIARNFCGHDPRVDAVFETALAALRDAGAELVEDANIETARQLGETEYAVLLYEFKADLNAYLGALDASAAVHSLADVIRFNEENADRVMPFFGQEIMFAAQEKGPLTEETYLRALETNHRLTRGEGIDATLQKHNLQAIVAPSGGPAWLTDYVNGDHYRGASSSPAAVAGYPAITVPAGYIFGLPVGLTFMGPAWSEPTLIRLAFAFEQATKMRRAPRLLPTVDLASQR